MATVNFNINNVAKTATCQATVTVSPKPQEVCKYDHNLPADSKECFEHCPIPGKEDMPKDSPKCKNKPPVTPPSQPPVTVVPSTGAAGVATSVIGTSALAYSLYAWVESRRALKSDK